MALEIRDARPGDAMAVAELHVRSWQAGYRDLLPQDRLEALRPEDRAERYDFDSSTNPAAPRTQVALLDGAVVGFATVALGSSPRTGELAALYIDPPYWGRGIGRALCARACARLAAAGCEEAILWLFRGNERGARFYLATGWEPEHVTRRETFWGFAEIEIERYHRALPREPSSDPWPGLSGS